MPKPVIATIASLITVLAIVILSLSFGWYLMILLVLLVPAMYIHITAMVRSLKWAPQYYPVMFLSSITFVLFSLFRPDGDVFGDFSGYSTLQFKLGLTEKPYTEVWGFALEVTMILVLLMVYLDLFLLVKAKKGKKKAKESNVLAG
jgi:hypothetical protein